MSKERMLKISRPADGTVVQVMPDGTVQPLEDKSDWEQGVREPDSAAKSYLRVIARNPQAVLDALEK